MSWPWIVGAVVVLVFLLAASSIQCRFSVIRRQQDDDITVDLHTMYGLVKRRLTIPVIKFMNVNDGVGFKKEVVNKADQQLQQDTKDRLTSEKIKTAFENAQVLLANCFHFNTWLRDTLSRVRCTGFYWKTNVGIGDAAETAMTTGMIWGLKSSLLGFLFRFIQLETKPAIQVVPQYNAVAFASEIQVFLKIRVWYVIMAGIQLLFRILKVKGGLKRWRSVLFKTS
ncbi:DUF2953 domain-containing protein [Paenibacillus sp. NPDC056579]|uniref:DUF2953 domain-containing protein n=1 Tax=unclassified Paenibacillus TaxID=185978 RepID=UPI001EF8414D|nr:DUF2953 domain-containing protein [Paenibacillus sp. H1-7]